MDFKQFENFPRRVNERTTKFGKFVCKGLLAFYGAETVVGAVVYGTAPNADATLVSDGAKGVIAGTLMYATVSFQGFMMEKFMDFKDSHRHRLLGEE